MAKESEGDQESQLDASRGEKQRYRQTDRLRIDRREALEDDDILRRNCESVSRRSERSGDQLLTKLRTDEEEEDVSLSISKGVTGERKEAR